MVAAISLGLEWGFAPLEPRKGPPDIEVWSDASGSWGCGAFSQNCWLQHQWLPKSDSLSIAVKMIPVVLAVALWGHTWKEKIVCFNSDNQAVVAVLSSKDRRDSVLAHLLHCLCLFAARHTFWFWAKHVPGQLNGAADALSRNQMIRFFESSPQGMQKVSTPLTEGLLKLL